ncbi:DUF1489 family protein [Plastorhodobacter daqingensis]|uniref:DUF1489 family protein n=1 Tax=Plastorhodobacter daqingensis TaxID=1387281 RepID=A0ABW2UP98_9RHOB
MATHVNILKLCVGAERVEDLIEWQAERRAQLGRDHALHITRMWPKRAAEVLAGGSIFWVFKGVILARQRIIGLEEITGADGILRCGLQLDPEVVRTEAAPRRPFQGWRYLDPKDSPRDLAAGRAHEEALPPELSAALAEIGVR